MIIRLLSGIWVSAAPALGNHLWQSTLFATVAGLLTLLLRKNQASARYWLWMAASVKFLVPFALLVAAGSFLSPRHSAPNSTGDFYIVMDTVSQPFSHAAVPLQTSVMASLMQMLPAFLAATWLCGFAAVLLTWLMRWRRISLAVRSAVPVQEGREVDALRKLAQAGGIRSPIILLLSRSSLEPGIFGITRPVLVWPEGISQRLEDAHLEAILAHEVWHVRRRDNLYALLHMLVEAIFWFHPLVWWLGGRLIEERERACDEQVLELGNHPQVYAESILKICEFSVGSPLACVAGVTGADLKQRIVNIMNQRITRKLDFTRKLLLASVGLLAIALPVIFGLVKPTQSRAESAPQTASNTGEYQDVSLTPGQPTTGGPIETRLFFTPDGMSAKNLGLTALVREAYGLKSDDQVSGVPDSLANATFNIEARIDPATKAARKKLNPEQAKLDWQRMFQTLLADQFRLVVHHDTKALPALALIIATNGPKLHQATPGDTYSGGIKGADGESPAGAHKMGMEPGRLTMQALPISVLANLLSMHTGKPVIDKTNLSGDYDVDLHWPTLDEARKADLKHVAVAKDGAKKVMFMSSGPEFTANISAAIEEQLGLRLDLQNLPLDVIVIDRAEVPQSK